MLSGGADNTSGVPYQLIFSFGTQAQGTKGNYHVLYDVRDFAAYHPNFYGSTYDVVWTAAHSYWLDVDSLTTGRSYSAGTEARYAGSLRVLDTSGNPTIHNGTNYYSAIGQFFRSNGTATNFANCYFAEIIQYKRGLTDAECATVETYLQNKWNVTVATQSVDPVLGSDNSYTP